MNIPYAHLNLRRNPFGDFSEADRTALAVVDIDAVVKHLKSPRFVVQFVGEKGYGKTTHLLAIRKRFSNAGYVHIPEGERSSLPRGNPILIDEAQRLTTWQRIRLFRKSVPLVLGTHRDFEAELKRAGRTVLTIAVECGTTTERLVELLNARIEWVRRGPGAVPTVTSETARQLHSDFGANIRGMLGSLYGTIEDLSAVADI